MKTSRGGLRGKISSRGPLTCVAHDTRRSAPAGRAFSLRASVFSGTNFDAVHSQKSIKALPVRAIQGIGYFSITGRYVLYPTYTDTVAVLTCPWLSFTLSVMKCVPGVNTFNATEGPMPSPP
jgi:hypothetical protein